MERRTLIFFPRPPRERVRVRVRMVEKIKSNE